MTGKPRQRENGEEGRRGMEGAKRDGVERMPGGPRRRCPGRVGRAGLAGFDSPSGPTCKIPFRLIWVVFFLSRYS